MRVWRNWQTHQFQVLASDRGGSSPSTRTTYNIVVTPFATNEEKGNWIENVGSNPTNDANIEVLGEYTNSRRLNMIGICPAGTWLIDSLSNAISVFS